MMKKLGWVIAATLSAGLSWQAYLSAHTKPEGAAGYKVVKSIPVAGEGGWDYVGVDSAARRIYVSHATRVVVLSFTQAAGTTCFAFHAPPRSITRPSRAMSRADRNR